MPRLCRIDDQLAAIVRVQDHIVHRDQALAHGLTPRAVSYRLQTGQWMALLPQVYLTHPGAPTRRQLLVSALLYCGPHAAIDGVDACRYHGLRAIAPDDTTVHVVVPWGSVARSHGFVVVRRTLAPISIVSTELIRYVGPAQAVIAATRCMSSPRRVLAALSDALQRRLATYEELVAAHVQGPPRGTRLADAALESLGAGTRSVPEADFRRLVLASATLPQAEYNVWLRLAGRRLVCVDALFVSSALIHETNGRIAHAREDLFHDMQERHDALTASGFIVLHNAPDRVQRRAREVIAEVERCHQLYAGRGMPAGVVIERAMAA